MILKSLNYWGSFFFPKTKNNTITKNRINISKIYAINSEDDANNSKNYANNSKNDANTTKDDSNISKNHPNTKNQPFKLLQNNHS